MTITPEQIASAWALVNAATKVPWQAKPSPFEVYNIDHGALPNHIVSGDTMIAALYGDEVDDPNAAFIAASRELVPQLLTALEAERAKVARLVDAARKTMAAADLREAYHRLPNDKHRIGDPKSPKGKARDAWLRSFRRAVSNTAAALTEIKETDHE